MVLVTLALALALDPIEPIRTHLSYSNGIWRKPTLEVNYYMKYWSEKAQKGL